MVIPHTFFFLVVQEYLSNPGSSVDVSFQSLDMCFICNTYKNQEISTEPWRGLQGRKQRERGLIERGGLTVWVGGRKNGEE